METESVQRFYRFPVQHFVYSDDFTIQDKENPDCARGEMFWEKSVDQIVFN